MSEIGTPPKVDFHPQDGTDRVTRLSTASDHGTTEQQLADRQSQKSDTPAENERAPAPHDPAVILAATLAHLDAGSRFSAEFSGTDGEGRPLVTSELGSYVVTYDAANEEEFQKISRQNAFDIRVLTIDKQIEAEIIRRDPDIARNIPVTLTLTGLASDLPLQTALPDPTEALSSVQAQYQASTLYRAESIAREIADKLHELPLPTTTPNYTVYGTLPLDDASKPLPPNIPAPNVATPNITATAATLFVQEQGEEASKIRPAPSVGLGPQSLIQQVIPALIVKNFPQVSTAPPAGLPNVVRKELEKNPLVKLNTGVAFTIRVEAIAVPEVPGTITPIAATPEKITPKTEAKKNTAASIATTTAPKDKPEGKRPLISAIVIDPGKNLQHSTPFKTTPATSRNAIEHNVYLTTPTSVIKLSSPQPLIPGTVISFSLSENEQTTATTPVTTTVTPPQPITPEFQQQLVEELIENWAALSLALSGLISKGETSAAQILSSRLPSPQNPAQMTSSMVFFLAAMGAPNPAETWLGKQVTDRMRQSGLEKLIKNLNEDMGRISRITADAPPGDWRPHLIPFQNGNDVNALPMLIRHIHEDEHKEKKDQDSDEEPKIKATRFILELSLSQMGNIMIDGMLRGRRLDIIVKSQNTVAERLKQKLTQIYQTSLESNGFDGDLVIKDNHKPDLSIKQIMKRVIHKSSSGTVVI